MTGVLFFVALLGWALGLGMIRPRLQGGAAILCALCWMLFASFFGGILLGWLVPTAWLLMAGGLALLPVGAVHAAVKRKKIFTPGLIFFVIASALLAVDAHGIVIQDHDSFSYWARAVKELYTFDRFYIQPGVNMFHLDYIPLLAGLEYSVVRVFGWQDAFMTYVPAACLTASVAAMADRIPRKGLALLAALLMSYAFRVFGFDPLALRSDGSMLLIFTAGLVCLYARSDDRAESLLPTLCAAAVLTGFKIYSGLMYAVVLLAAMACEAIRLRGRKPAALWVSCGAALVLILLMQLGWSAKYNLCMAAMQGGEAQNVLGGNPRTAALLHSFTPENIAQFVTLAKGTFVSYVHSTLPWAFAFALAAVLVAWRTEKRGAVVRLMVFLLIAGVIYLLGLFASYFVQSETSGQSNVYLATASTPLVIAAVFCALWCLKTPRSWLMPAAMAVGLVLLFSPARLFADSPKEYQLYAAHAYDFYTEELDGVLTPEDAGRRALLIDSTYASSEIRSQSGKTHCYQYFALPLRVMEPVYLHYGDYSQWEDFDAQHLLDRIENENCDMLIVRIEDDLYWEAVRDGLGLWGDWDEPVGVYDISQEDGEYLFTMREW